MKTQTRLMEWAAGAALLVGLGLARAAGPAHVEIEPLDLDPALIAKIAKAKAKSNTVNDKVGTSGDVVFDGGTAGRSSCGNVDIGNVTTNGPAWKAPREITVVVTGDVVNAGNNCKR